MNETKDTFKSLTAEYDRWLKAHPELPNDMSADELREETHTGDFALTDDDYICNETQRMWLASFSRRWEKACNE